MDEIKKALEFEEKFKFVEAMKIYEKIIEKEGLKKVKKETLENYVKLLEEFQEYKKAIKIYEELEKNDIRYRIKLAELNEKVGEEEKAIIYYKKSGNIKQAEKIEKRRYYKNLEVGFVEKFMDLFEGREGVYSIQWFSDGKGGYYPKRQSIGKKDYIGHFKGKKTIGLYQIKKDNSIKFAAFDIDIKKGVAIENERDIKRILKKVVLELKEGLLNIGLKGYLEFSGGKGYHIWIFFESNIQSYKIKNVMEDILLSVELSEEIGVEIFPKQTEVKGNGLGNLIKIPLGIHRKTMKRCLFVDDELNSIDDQKLYVKNIEYSSEEKVIEAYKNIDRVEFINNKEKRKTNRGDNSIKSEIRNELVEENDDIKIQNLEKNCVVFSYLKEKIDKSGILSFEEERLLIAILNNIENGEKIVKNILLKTINFSEKRIKISINRSSKYPISCEEIRRKIEEHNMGINTDYCACRFEERYNTPINYIYKLEEYFEKRLSIEDILKRVLKKQKEKQEIDKEIENLKNIINLKMIKDEEECFLGRIKKLGESVEIIV